MFRLAISDLNDCTEFRQTLAAKPPKIVHGTALLLSGLLGLALGWAALTRANLVVLAQGRVRSQEIPTRVFTPNRGASEGIVAEAPFDEGDIVRKGDVLVRLDSTRIENSIAKLTRTVEAGEEELANLIPQRELLAEQCRSAESKSTSELQQAEQSVRLATERRASDIRQAKAELESAEATYNRIRKLIELKASTPQELSEATAKLQAARERLVQAELPVDESSISVARQTVELVAKEFAVRSADLEARIAAKQGEVEAARNDLANLTLDRDACELRSPIDGVVVAGRIRVGDVLEPGRPVMELAPQATYCFEAAVSGADVGDLKVGMPVRIRFDAYDYQRYGALEGTVTYLSPDSQPIDPETQAGEAKLLRSGAVAFVVRIAMSGDEVGRGDFQGPVKLGLGGTAEIVIETESVLKILIKRIRKTISLV